MTSVLTQAVQMQAGGFAQSVGTAVARQQIDAQKSVADMVAQTAVAASPPAPAGQGQRLDVRV
ncbi:putative motility protein [Methylobacterium sp. J-076]|uniref:putative motility protein n=1 Tax=Methylobacterium sp. J-076 TaxID=2836655 RepID=UPI001FBAE3FD|nr:putative motility protein [Methylobacterium sp. J-076]MCJ2014758.1 putative motility protein [Methylobacterium sp. J-076]